MVGGRRGTEESKGPTSDVPDDLVCMCVCLFGADGGGGCCPGVSLLSSQRSLGRQGPFDWTQCHRRGGSDVSLIRSRLVGEGCGGVLNGTFGETVYHRDFGTVIRETRGSSRSLTVHTQDLQSCGPKFASVTVTEQHTGPRSVAGRDGVTGGKV